MAMARDNKQDGCSQNQQLPPSAKVLKESRKILDRLIRMFGNQLQNDWIQPKPDRCGSKKNRQPEHSSSPDVRQRPFILFWLLLMFHCQDLVSFCCVFPSRSLLPKCARFYSFFFPF